jgi:hypothetical protein
MVDIAVDFSKREGYLLQPQKSKAPGRKCPKSQWKPDIHCLWTVMTQSSLVNVDQVLKRWGVEPNLQLYCTCKGTFSPRCFGFSSKMVRVSSPSSFIPSMRQCGALSADLYKVYVNPLLDILSNSGLGVEFVSDF